MAECKFVFHYHKNKFKMSVQSNVEARVYRREDSKERPEDVDFSKLGTDS